MEQSAEFWQDNVKAANVQKKKSQIEGLLKKYAGAQEPLDEAEVYLELAREEEEPGYESDIVGYLDQAFALLEDLEVAVVLSGPNDNKPAFITINAGAGGTESQDWADMLLRMYLRYCDSQGWKADLMDLTPGDEAGIKGATVAVEGDYAYGYLKAEIGIHRLVRISPFDAAARRHTSFASVFAFPQVDDSIEIDIDDKDLRLDVYRASGAGGQKVNKTSSAVRITHIPSGIVVQCQNERSQLRNKEVAFKVLRSRLMEVERDKQDAEKKETESTKMRIDFGSQIRSYVLAPYRLVKDHRTKHEMGNANAVLDGDIHTFIKAFLLSGQEMEAGKPRG